MQQNKLPDLNDILSTIKDLVSFRTTGDRPSELRRAAEYVKNFFKGSRVFLREHEFNGVPALFVTTRDTIAPHILLQGHLDVVEGNDEQFKAELKGNKLYGRGTVDMKSFVALGMHLVKSADNSESDIGIMITFDEETGSENGTAKLAELGYGGDILFNGDGGYNYSVIYGEKGILKFKIKTEAQPGRHPYPWEGKNAFDLFVSDYKKIISFFPDKYIATDIDNWHSTYSIYDVKVSNSEQYPPHCVKAKMNIYFSKNISTAELLKNIKNKIHYSTIEDFVRSERVFINPDSEYIKSLRKIMSKNFNREIELKAENGSSDARFYADKNIPIVIVKVVGEDHHGDKEHIIVDELLPMLYTMNDFVDLYSQPLEKDNESKYQNAV